jgi:single-stranded DNA-specific DHH superfamily exonuclease
LKPFGRGNPAVKLLLRNARVKSIRPFGKTNTHAEIHLDIGQALPGQYLPVTAWSGAADLALPGGANRLTPGQPVDMVIEPKIETYGGPRPAGTLVDLRLL